MGITTKGVSEFNARANTARQELEPIIRDLADKWDAKHQHIDGGGAPSFFSAIGQVIGRIYAEKLPGSVPPTLAFELITTEIHLGMMEVLGAPAGSARVQ